MRSAPLLLVLAAVAAAGSPSPFRIDVVDDATGRGVPLVELTTTGQVRFVTDSGGIVAFDEPGLLGEEVFFHVKSHGYEFPADGFGMRGVRLRTEPGGRATIRIRRINVAERLYRTTGAGIYRDTLLVGATAPIAEPVANGGVVGQDSVLAIPYRGRIRWFWGDTNRVSYPLGNFAVSGATSALDLDPDKGIDLRYFVGPDGFSRPMCPLPGDGPKWVDGLMLLPDAGGRERLVGAFVRVKSLDVMYERGLVLYDDEKEAFERFADFDLEETRHPFGHPFPATSEGRAYYYFGEPFPTLRVPASFDAVKDPNAYERLEPAVALRDVETGKPVRPHRGSIAWNGHRRRFLAIFGEAGGTSNLGEIWFAEADHLLGPWVYARKVVTHDRYSFYNPKHHPLLDRDGGRLIHFEGTYTTAFSGNDLPTPRYDYNQVLYRLDLDDPRLALPVPVYRAKDGSLATRDGVKDWSAVEEIAFFALERAGPGTVDLGGFHGLPADAPPSSALLPHSGGRVWTSPVRRPVADRGARPR